jgi:hypothetical protein
MLLIRQFLGELLECAQASSKPVSKKCANHTYYGKGRLLCSLQFKISYSVVCGGCRSISGRFSYSDLNVSKPDPVLDPDS